MSKYTYDYYAFTHKSAAGYLNQDRVMIDSAVLCNGEMTGTNKTRLSAIICDGVGMSDRGEIAAEILASKFLGFHKSPTRPQIEEIITKCDTKLSEMNNTETTGSNYSLSTIAGTLIEDDRITIFNVGDTRIYSFYAGVLTKLSEDHIVIIRNQETNSQKKYLTRCIGDGESSLRKLLITEGIINKDNGFIIIASDGFYNNVSINVLNAILSKETNLHIISQQINKLLQGKDFSDDTSYVIIKSNASHKNKE